MFTDIAIGNYCHTCISTGNLSMHQFVCLSVYLHPTYKKSKNSETLQLFHFTDCFISMSENKDDNSHSSGACFHIFEQRYKINFNKVLYVYFIPFQLKGESNISC